MANIDAITLEVMKHALLSAAEAESVVTRRTAHSLNIRERTDYSTGICTAQGDLVAQALRTPIHLGGLAPCVQELLKEYGDDILPGDLFLSNDPYSGGQHPPDVQVSQPIFCDGTLTGFACVLAHHADLGGHLSAGAKEVFEEGLRLHHVKFYEGGEVNRQVERIIAANVRHPSVVFGDLRAQMAAVRTGASRVEEMCRRYSTGQVVTGMHDLMDASELRMKHSLGTIPRGRYRWEDFIDSDGSGGGPCRVVTSVTVGEGIEIDFTGTDPQGAGAINSCLTATRSAVYYAVRALCDPDIMQNQGCYRNVRVIAPVGTLVNPRFPSACAGRSNIAHRIADCIFGALSSVVPERVEAAGYGTSPCYHVYGYSPTPWYLIDCNHGSGGARQELDGNDGTTTKTSNPQNLPMEATEAEVPVRFTAYEFCRDSGGAGRRRGGLALKRSWLSLGSGTVEVRADRKIHPPYGLKGGGAGQAASVWIRRADGQTEELGTAATATIYDGDEFALSTAGGGGFGDPRVREPERVLGDVMNDRVSAHEAASTYGVVVRDGEVDQLATDKLRHG